MSQQLMKSIVALHILLLLPAVSFAQADWEFRKERQGIKIYTRDVAGSVMKATRAETVFDAPVGNCISVLKDVDRFTTLFPSCMYAERISDLGDTVQTQYMRLKAPWPVANRDYAFKYIFRTGDTKGAVKVITQCVPNAYPPDKSFIRLDKGEGLWVFTPTQDGRTKLVYEFHGSPGGSVPEWLANTSVVDSPLGMLENFHRLVKEARHHGKRYGFMK